MIQWGIKTETKTKALTLKTKTVTFKTETKIKALTLKDQDSNIQDWDQD